ncbi:4'-phosphopantetheinyl transferase [Puniceibacterium sp. IMCC21224]|uniref:4'-phosphopantetheinyl transferase family protein n=1 Tax=Puniceibacterium sp. IMCC21224 TaxID=1618204 RepID=UPI00064DBAF3|nr:4'-phosphopantetheinyl transferase superfamily protein [Puniceibacterium sp. IMCC21224]KMK65644.1 4'-phosphopantetheinyl transferase superfamily protein [Puniceibacterium sp. IMCC21224]
MVQDLKRLLDVARADLPSWLSVAVSDPRDPQSPLFPVEEAAIARAIVARRKEFSAGRVAARSALSAFDLVDIAVPMAEDRTPVWPAGIIGSITHTDTACVAVVARNRDARSVGIDLEPLTPLPPETVTQVCSLSELQCLPDAPLIAARRIFCAKEAAYKAQYALSNTLFDFKMLTYGHNSRGAPHLRFDKPVPPFIRGDRLALRQWTGFGLILSLVTLPVLHDAL